MKNTLAISVILIGGILVYGGYKDYSFADTIRFFTGQKLKGNGAPKIKIQPPPLPEGSTNPDGTKAGPVPPGITPRLTPGPGGLSS